MKNCASLYTALSHRPLCAHQLFSQNTLVPRNVLPKASSSTSGIPQISYCPIYLLLSQQLSLLNTSAEKKSTHEYGPPQLHTYLFQNQIAQLFQKIAPLPVLLSFQQGFSSYTLDTIPNDTSLHKQHGLCSSMSQAYYINVSPIEGNSLMRFSSPTKSRSIQTPPS